MDSETDTASQDHIPLYGLFGDSTTTLQGLNDHLCPSSLQQSPPCGSAYSSIYQSVVTMSPLKVGVASTTQPHGVLLSDFAEHSPSAGSATAATICTHVSFDNLRCTNLVNSNGKRYCSQHQDSSKGLVHSSPSSIIGNTDFSTHRTSLSQTISFVSPSMLHPLPSTSFPSFSNGTQALAGKSLHSVRVGVKSLPPGSISKKGTDVTDSTRTMNMKKGDFIAPIQITKSQFGQKVGQKITVATTRIPSAKVVVNGALNKQIQQNSITTLPKPSFGSQIHSKYTFSTTAPNRPNINTQLNSQNNSSPNGIAKVKFSTTSPQTHKTVRLNVIKPSTPVNVTNRLPQSSVLKKAENTVIKTVNSQINSPQKSKTTSTSANSQAQPVTIASKPLQSLMIDESTLKTLLDVLNSQSDMTPQQQISLLRSLGITVVQAPIDGKMISTKKQHPPKSTLLQKTASSGTKSKVSKESVVMTDVKDPIVQNGTAPSKSGHAHSGMMQTIPTNVYNNNMTRVFIPNTVQQTGSFLGTNLTETSKLGAKNNVSDLLISEKNDLKRKKKINDKTNFPTKKKKSNMPDIPAENNLMTVPMKADQNIKLKGKQTKISTAKTKHTKSKNRSSQARPESQSSGVQLPPRPPSTLLKVPPQVSPLQKYVKLYNEEVLKNHDLFDDAPREFESDLDTGTAKESTRAVKTKLLKKLAAKSKKSKTKLEIMEESLKNMTRFKFHVKLFEARKLLHNLSLPRSVKHSQHRKHHEEILRESTEKHELESLHDKDKNIDQNPEDDKWLLEGRELLGENNCEELLEEAKLANTLSTQHLKRKYEELEKDIHQQEEELNLLMQSYNEDPVLTTRLLDSTFPDFLAGQKNQKEQKFHSKQCRLSNSNGLSCSSSALPYALYCKQHIWHCQSQCLYKLDQNMKPAADISPEPFVKKVRKRTKLLPLIKRYKKKKKKKILLGSNDAEMVINKEEDQATDAKVAIRPTPVLKNSTGEQKVINDFKTIKIRNVSGNQCSVARMIDSTKKQEADVEEAAKSLDTSEEDLHLTGHEMMFSGVFDKLPEDLHDFDLFTTVKGAEELERALLLAAASSPTPEQENEKAKDESEDLTPSLDDSENEIIETQDKKKEEVSPDSSSPDGCVVLDVPRTSKTTETPPSIESFNQSQCVHYTFGSNFAMNLPKQKQGSECNDSAKEEEEYSSEEDLIAPLLSAEDLQDIEGVLESLQKVEDDINSPLLPSSPAVDQYTSMLARQLSQEVETESLKRLSASSHLREGPKITRTSSTVPESLNIQKNSQDSKLPSTLSRTFSLPVSDSNNNNTFTSMSTTPDRTFSNKSTKQPIATVTTSSNVDRPSSSTDALPKMEGPNFIDPLGLDIILPSLHEKSQLSGIRGVIGQGTSQPSSNTSSNTRNSVTATSTAKIESANGQNITPSSSRERKTTKKNSRKSSQMSTNMGTNLSRTPQRKLNQPSPAIVSNQVLPLTLMQTPSAGGNIIKVIVPPGTVMNGAGNSSNSHQNMILIPVSALVRSDVISSSNQNIPVGVTTTQQKNLTNHSVKTQLSSLQAGQQFLILNNNTSASSQPHLTLVQKRNNITGTPQTLLLNPAPNPNLASKNLFNVQSASNQKAAAMKGTKQVLCNIKPNMNVYLNQTINKFVGSRNEKLVTSSSPSANKSNTKAINVSAKLNFPTCPSTMATSTLLNTKLRNTTFSNFTSQPYDIHKVHKAQAKKPAKARFDPITKKYVPGNSNISTDTQSLSISTTMSDSMLKEKFNASALSIQNKVQQINSVLSSLNSAKANSNNGKQNGQTTGQGQKRNTGRNKVVKSVTVPVNNIQRSTMFISTAANSATSLSQTSLPMRQGCFTVSMPAVANVPATDAATQKNSITISVTRKTDKLKTTTSNTVTPPPKEAAVTLKRNDKCDLNTLNKTLSPNINVTTSSHLCGDNSTASGTADFKQKTVTSNVSSGTVHWNQTTTAGPEVTPGITVPLYITAGTWTSELGVNPLSRANIPIIFPAHKISPNYQLPQRVILGNIGSLGILSSKNNPHSQTPTITISAHPTKSLNKVDAKYMSSTTSDITSMLTSSSLQNLKKSDSTTNVTAVMGTTMSPKLSPLSKTSFPERFATIDQQGILHVYKPGGKSSSTHPTKPNPTYVLSVKNPHVPQSVSSNLKHLKCTNVSQSISTSSTSVVGTQLSVTECSMSENFDHNANLKLSSSGANEEKIARKKCARKASHDTILHDPLMFDPTALDLGSGDNETATSQTC